MRQLPGSLLILAAFSLGIGLVVRVIRVSAGTMSPALYDPDFFWRGAMALLLMAILIVLIQIRDR